MVNRISGLSSSGMDIETMVKQLMTAQRAPLDKLTQKKQSMQWQRDDYRTMNSKVLDLKNTAFTMKLQSTYLTKKASSTDSDTVSVAASPSATEGNYSIKINRLAEAASLTSSNPIGAAAKSGTASTLNDLGMSGTGPTAFTVSGQKGATTIQLESLDTLATFLSSVNNKSSITGVKVSYDSTMDRLFFTSITTGDKSNVNISSTDSSFISDVMKLTTGAAGTTGGTVTGTVPFQMDNGSGTQIPSSLKLIDSTLTSGHNLVIHSDYDNKDYTFNIDKTTSIGQLIDSINSSGIGQNGVSAYVNATTGQLNIFNPDNTKSLKFTDATSGSPGVVESLGLPTTATGGTNTSFQTVGNKGKNAKVNFNTIDVEYASNTFAINGMTFTAKKAQLPADKAITISVNKDVDSVFNSIKSFVDKYNDIISGINDKISQKHDRNYTPLLDAQKTSMKDPDIKLWEDKAKEGLLHNDFTLSSALNSFRFGLSQTVSGLPGGDLSQLADIGITTTANYLDKGKLYIDENKLKDALSNRPEQVIALFTTDDGNASSTSGDGLANRLFQLTDNVLGQLKQKAGTASSVGDQYDIGKAMIDLDKRISDMNRKYSTMETRYYKQFTAMDSALNKMNSQMASFMSQIGGSTGK